MSKQMMLKTGMKLLKSGKEKKSKGRGPKPHEPGDDPFYYHAPLYDSHGHEKLDRKGRPKTKKRRKNKQYYVEQLGIPKEDAKILLKMKKRAMLMDGGKEFLGIRIPLGLSTPLTLFFPVGGAIADFGISNAMVQRSSTVSNGIGKTNYSRMSANIVQDLLIGLIPVVGAVVDMFYRANTRNANLLEKILIKRVQTLKLEQEKGYPRHDGDYMSDDSMGRSSSSDIEHPPRSHDDRRLYQAGSRRHEEPTRQAKSTRGSRNIPQDKKRPSRNGSRRGPTDRRADQERRRFVNHRDMA